MFVCNVWIRKIFLKISLKLRIIRQLFFGGGVKLLIFDAFYMEENVGAAAPESQWHVVTDTDVVCG